jgi:hypothetical protein
MGLSSRHASTVPLILIPDSGAIAPAFHVVFDDWFATVALDELPDFNSEAWQRLFGDFKYQFPLRVLIWIPCATCFLDIILAMMK